MRRERRECQTARRRQCAAFTFIELLAAIALMAVMFVPMLGMFSAGLQNVNSAKRREVAINLAREELELLRMRGGGLAFDGKAARRTRTLKGPGGNTWTVVCRSLPHTQPLEVRIEVYEAGRKRPDFDLVTYVMGFDASGCGP